MRTIIAHKRRMNPIDTTLMLTFLILLIVAICIGGCTFYHGMDGTTQIRVLPMDIKMCDQTQGCAVHLPGPPATTP